MKNRNSPILPILTVNFISTLGYSIVMPFLVFLVTKFDGNAFLFGILGAVYPAFQLIGAPLLGKWSDVYGRKKMLIISEAGTLLGWIIFFTSFFLPLTIIFTSQSSFSDPLVITLPLIFVFAARAIDGLTGGNISIANAYLSDISTERNRNKNFGMMSMSSNLGFIVGPALAGLLGGTALEEMLPVIAASLISLFSIAITYLLLPDLKPSVYKGGDEQPATTKVLGFENKECFLPECDEKITFRKIMKLEYIPYFLFLNFLIFLAFNFFYTAFPVYVVKQLGWSIGEMGLFFSILSLIMVMVQGPVLGFASRRFSEKILVLAGSLILGINFILLLSENTIVLYIAAVFFAFGNGLMWPSFLTLLSEAAGKKFQGSVQGIASSAGSLAAILGLIAGGWLYELFGSATFLMSAGVTYLVFFLAFKLPGGRMPDAGQEMSVEETSA